MRKSTMRRYEHSRNVGSSRRLGIQKLTELFNSMYNTGQITDDLVKYIFITLPKKPKVTMSITSLMPHNYRKKQDSKPVPNQV